jgi:hypothetical protein
MRSGVKGCAKEASQYMQEVKQMDVGTVALFTVGVISALKWIFFELKSFFKQVSDFLPTFSAVVKQMLVLAKELFRRRR